MSRYSHIHYLEIISHIKWKDGYVCRKCSCESYQPGTNYYYGRKCKECHYEESAIRFTTFANCRDLSMQINILKNLDILKDMFYDKVSNSSGKGNLENNLPSLLRKSIYSSAEGIGVAASIDDKTVKRFLSKLEPRVLINLIELSTTIDIQSIDGIENMLRIIINNSIKTKHKSPQIR